MGKNRGLSLMRGIIILVSLVILAGCTTDASLSPEVATSTPTPPIFTPAAGLSTVTPAITAPGATLPAITTPQNGENASPTPSIAPRTLYKLDMVFDYHQHTLAVTETINYVNLAAQGLSELLLVVEANRRPGVFSLESLAWQSGENIDGYDLTGD
jgi:hypothetical protein